MLKQFNSNSRKLNRIITKFNPNSLVSTDLTGSLNNIEIPTTNKFNSNVRSNPNPTKLINNKGKINNFYQEILQYGARYVKKNIDAFDNVANTLTLYNTTLDYGTESPTAENFEILTFGLHIPGDYVINQIGNDIVITLNERYIDFDNITLGDIYVFGKFK